MRIGRANWLIPIVLACLAGPAAAQDMPTVLPNNYVLSDILNRQRVEASIGAPLDRPARSSAKKPAQPATPRSAPAASTSYRPSPAVSVRVRGQFVGWMRGRVGAADAGKLATAFEQNDPVHSWAQIVAADGLHPNDLADSLAGYWILNWVMANSADNNRAQVLAVRRQVAAMLSTNPALARLSEAQRQEMSETFILNFLIQHAAYDDAVRRGDRDGMRRLGDAAVRRFGGEMGVDLRQLRLTETGFVPTGK